MNVVESIFKDNLKKQILDITDINLLKKIQEGWVAPSFTKQARALLEELNIKKRFIDYEFIDVEIKLDGMPIIELDDVIITYKGFIDLVLRHKITGRYLIIDWKTSRKRWNINDKEKGENFYTQLKLYKHFYSLKKGIPIDEIDLAFYNLPRDEAENQKQYNKNFSNIEIEDFIKEFEIKCKNIYKFNMFALDKAKFTTKKNFCNRCAYNNLVMCDGENPHQLPNLNLLNK